MSDPGDNTRASGAPADARFGEALREIDAALAAGNLARAAAFAEQALGHGREDARLLSLAAYQKLQRADAAGAVVLLERAKAFDARDVHVLNALGIALRQAGRPHDARAAFDEAIAAAPAFTAAHFNKGTVLEDLGAFEEARQAYEAALAGQPDNPDALSRLSYLAALRGEHEEALALGKRALANRPAGGRADDPVRRKQEELHTITVARAEIEAGKFADAQRRLEAIEASADSQTRYSVLGLIGECHHALGNNAAAFDCFSRAKSEQRRLFAPLFERPGVERFLTRVERIRAFVSQNDRPWRRPAPAGAPVRVHAFLVGFPRSGTTLLEAALAGHGEIATVEEKDTLDEAVRAYFEPAEGIHRLMDASEQDLAPFREAYWRRCRQHAPSLDGRIFLDKVPLNTVFLGLIARLFPDAKILFAIRDPRDVVFSCFRHVFAPNIAMHEFSSLDGAARLYDAVMRLAGLYRAQLDLPFHDYRYEAAVADFEGEVRRVCDFLGAGWDPGALEFRSKARARPLSTPSAVQLTRGLYDGEGQWRPYAAQMTGVMSALSPWVAHFGYAG